MKTKRLLSVVLVFAMLITIFSAIPVFAEEDTIYIRTQEDWDDLVDGGVVYEGQLVQLQTDITVKKPYWFAFRGIFDGCGHKVTLDVTAEYGEAGMFSDLNGTVKNLYICGYVYGNTRAAGLAAEMSGGTLVNCVNEASINGSDDYSGGLVGYLKGGSIVNCANYGDVCGTQTDSLYGEKLTDVAEPQNCYCEGIETTAEQLNIEAEKHAADGWSLWYASRGREDAPFLSVVRAHDAFDGMGIYSQADWDAFVQSGKDYAGEKVFLQTDVTVNTPFQGTFRGTFDGHGHLAKLKLSTEDTDEYLAVFSSLDGATVKNLLTAGYVKGARVVAGIAGEATDTTLLNCGNEARLSYTAEDKRGEIAEFKYNLAYTKEHYPKRENYANEEDWKSDCKDFDEHLQSLQQDIQLLEGMSGFAGGIVARFNSGNLFNCFNYGSINADTDGCLIGYGDAVVSNCYNKGESTSAYDLAEAAKTHDGWSGWYSSKPHGGNPWLDVLRQTDYLRIYTTEDWNRFADPEDEFSRQRTVVLEADIVVTVPRKELFDGGSFDGNGHKIILNIDGGPDDEAPIGLFYSIERSEIKNLYLFGKVTGKAVAGGLVGEITNSDIISCINEATVNAPCAGGLVGRNLHPLNLNNITNCANYGRVNDNLNGCMAGDTAGMSFVNCYNKGTVVSDQELSAMNAKADELGVSRWYSSEKHNHAPWLEVLDSHDIAVHFNYVIYNAAGEMEGEFENFGEALQYCAYQTERKTIQMNQNDSYNKDIIRLPANVTLDLNGKTFEAPKGMLQSEGAKIKDSSGGLGCIATEKRNFTPAYADQLDDQIAWYDAESNGWRFLTCEIQAGLLDESDTVIGVHLKFADAALEIAQKLLQDEGGISLDVMLGWTDEGGVKHENAVKVPASVLKDYAGDMTKPILAEISGRSENMELSVNCRFGAGLCKTKVVTNATPYMTFTVDDERNYTLTVYGTGLDGVVILALYNGADMLELENCEIVKLAELKGTFEEDGEYAKAMWWDSTANMNPVADDVDAAVEK